MAYTSEFCNPSNPAVAAGPQTIRRLWLCLFKMSFREHSIGKINSALSMTRALPAKCAAVRRADVIK